MCNIAGIMIDSSIIDVDPDEFDRILAVNLKGVLYGCQAAGKVMVAQRGGSIINMASAAVLAPAPGIGPYAICKAGVAQLTQSMAVEVGKHGVRVNSVAPGFVPTNMTARYYTNPDGTVNEEAKAATLAPMAKFAPLRRVGRDVGHRLRRAVSRFGRQQLRHGAAAQPQRRHLHVLLSDRPLRHAPGRADQDRRIRSNWPVVVSEAMTAGSGPSSVTAAPTPTASLTAPCGTMRNTHDVGEDGDACGQAGSLPARSSTSAPGAGVDDGARHRAAVTSRAGASVAAS